MEISQLVDRCKKGDTEALGMLYATYSKPLTKVCRRYLSDKQVISDVLHDSFVVIITSLGQLRDNNKVEKWMKTITKNVALQYINYQKTHNIVSVEYPEKLEVFSDESQQVEIEVSMNELMGFVDKLPEGCAQIFRLSVFEGLTHTEIAEKLGIAPHSSSSQLARAKSMLRKMIRQNWAVFLLFLIPISFFLLKKEGVDVSEETQLVADQKETQNIQPKEPEQTTLNVEQPTRHTVVCDTDIIRKTQKQKSVVVVSDTTTPADQIVIASDSLCDEQSRDTIQFIQKKELPHYDLADVFPHKKANYAKKSQKWTLGFAYAGSFDEQDKIVMIDDGGDITPGPGVVIPTPIENNVFYTKHHYMPIVLSLSAHYHWSERAGVESGVSYIRQISDFEMDSSDIITNGRLQTIHYIGIPAKCFYEIVVFKNWSLYGNLGVAMDIPIHSQFNKHALLQSSPETIDTTDIRVPLQWSVGTGLGLQYNITPNIGVFAEPSIQYYFPTKTNFETYYTEHPLSFSLPLGIKFIW